MKHRKEMLWLPVMGSDAQGSVKQRQKYAQSSPDSSEYESQGIKVTKRHEKPEA